MAGRRRTPLAPEGIEPHLCTLDLRRQILRQTPFFAGLPPAEVDRISLHFSERGYQPGETVYHAGEPATRLYVVAAGKVKLVRPTPAGQNVLLDILPPGDFFGSLATLGDREYPDTAEAQTACCLLSVDADQFAEILRAYPAVALATLEIVAERLRDAHEVIEHLSAHPVEARLAATLLKLAERLGAESKHGVLIQMPLSRQDLAEMTGTTAETASRIMSEFRRAGLIRSGRRWVAITDPAGLAKFAEAHAGR